MLVQAGARLDQPGERGFTPLRVATAQGPLEACKLFVALGATPVRNEDGQLPSESAAVGGKQELASWLAAHGFLPCIQADCRGRATIIPIAAGRQRLNTALDHYDDTSRRIVAFSCIAHRL